MLIDHAKNPVAVIQGDTGETLGYQQLGDAAATLRTSLLDDHEGLAFLLPGPDFQSVITYVALRTSAVPVVLLDPAMNREALADLVDHYRPSLIFGLDRCPPGYASAHGSLIPASRRIDRSGSTTPEPGQDAVSVLLPTSGSTGNPKLVQLSESNLDANAEAIVTSLSIESDDRALNPLPLFYSYGLSILNSHLAAGATTVLTSAGPIRSEFWDMVADLGVTSIPGVPYSYEMYQRVGLLDKDLRSVRYMTQAGGKLAKSSVVELHAGLSAKGIRFLVMYGQTEAGPRMSVLPSEDLPTYAGSVGFALNGGRFEILDPDEHGSGEVLYHGPNVMLGYAGSPADIGVRSQNGPLHTGDIGRLDTDGRLSITGRLKRMAKLFGTRVNLDDIEAHFADFGPVAALEGKNRITIFSEGQDGAAAKMAKAVERQLRVPPRTIRVRAIERLPLTANGKIDYQGLPTDE